MNVEFFAILSKNLFTVLKKLKECVGFFFFNNLIATNVGGFAFVPLTDNSNFSTKLQSGITPNPVLALGFKNFRVAFKTKL